MKKSAFMDKFGKFFRTYSIVAVLAFVFIFFSITTDAFLTPANILNIIRAVSMVGLICCGYSLVMISGGVDISTGWIMCLSMVMMTRAMVVWHWPTWISVLLGILVSIACYWINCIIAIKVNISSFLVTLATMYVFRGIVFLITGAKTTTGLPAGFNYVGQGYIFGKIPVAVVILIVCTIITHIVLNKTIFGRCVFAIGGNPEAANLSGINVNKYKMLIYAWCGVFVGIASWVMLSRLNTGYPAAAEGYEFKAILACCVGGVSFSGGIGKVLGVFCGAVVIGMLSNGMTLMGVSEYWQYVINGALMLGAIVLDQYIQQSAIRRAKSAQAKTQELTAAKENG